MIPGLGRSTGEGIGYPPQYSWVSLVAQPVKSPPAMREICVRSLGWEDLLEKGKATHSSILAWRIPWASLIAQLVKNPPASAGDPSSIPELGRSAGEGIGY